MCKENQSYQEYYTPKEYGNQALNGKNVINIEEMIPSEDSVRLLNMLMERMDYRKLYGAYERLGRTETDPKKLYKVLVYGYMNWYYSSRKIERACKSELGSINDDTNTLIDDFYVGYTKWKSSA